MSEDISELKEKEKESTTINYSNNWIGGLILVAIGVIFLLANTTGFQLHNWWALFILIPALANFGNAWRHYQTDGHLSKGATGSLTGGLILTLVASAFLFNLDWGLIWPVFLIIGGIGALLSSGLNK